MRIIILIIIMLCINVIAEVQIQTYKGIVTDSKGNAIPFANAVLYTLPDSTFTNNVYEGNNIYDTVSFCKSE